MFGWEATGGEDVPPKNIPVICRVNPSPKILLDGASPCGTSSSLATTTKKGEELRCAVMGEAPVAGKGSSRGGPSGGASELW
jgi:hypothetical protein